MEFIGRAQELAVLERQWSRGESFVVIYGRRRVGKTRLIKQFMDGKNALYFLASKESVALNRGRFAQAVAHFAGMPEIGEGTFSDWRPLFHMLATSRPQERKLLVIDEFPYLVEGDGAFPSILQYAWDEVLRSANVMLILCGSSTHMMEEAALSHASPLYGRSTAQIRLKPLEFEELQTGFGWLSFEDQMRVHAITGGVPKYLEFFDGQSVEEVIQRDILSTSGFLYNEPRFLLSQDTRNPITHYSIMRAIANGKHKLSEIAAMLERPQPEISPYLRLLERLGYIRRSVPTTDPNPDRSKNGLYFICDGLLKFWFTYVLPFESELELGNSAPSLRLIDTTFESQFVAFSFESVSRHALSWLCGQGLIPFEPHRIGSFWNRKSTVEIDVCATSLNGDMLVGECKYHERKPFSTREYDELVEKVSAAGLSCKGRMLRCLFSKTGFEPKLMELAQQDDSLFLVNRNELLNV